MRGIFSREAPAAASSPFRIGTWRVLAASARTPAEREGWVSKIEAEALDPAPDPMDPNRRLRAFEALGKLRVPVHGALREATRAFAAAAAPAAAPLPLWVLALAGDTGAPARLADLLSDPDPVARQRAAFALRWVGSADPSVLGKLRRAADAEPASSPAWPFLASAGLFLDPGAPDAPAWRSGLETLPPGSSPDAKFEAAQALMPSRNAEDLRRMVALLDDPDDAVRVSAAWTILYTGVHGGAAR
jgi:HEAT repeat protein